MTTVTKLRRLPDGSLEHYLESTETPAQLAARTAQMLENATPADPFEGRAVERVVMTPRNPDGSGGELVKVVRMQDAPAPPSEVNLARAKKRLAELDAIIAAPASDVASRISAKV